MKKSDFNKLQAKWYKKIAEDGFNDIEQDEIYFKSGTRSCRRKDLDGPYYEMAADFLREHKFQSNLETIIWEYHTNGISTRDISKLLTKARRKYVSHWSVHMIIVQLEAAMKDKYLLK